MKNTPRRRAWDIFALERLLINIEAKSFSREAVFTARTHGASVLANFSTVYFPRYYTRPNVSGPTTVPLSTKPVGRVIAEKMAR